jgi:MFS family permease
VFGFGSALLTERGMTLVAASAATSVMLWVLAAGIPFGGMLADRSGRRDLVLIAGLAGFAAGMLAVRAGFPPVVGFAVTGAMAALPVGPILSLPAAVLKPQMRAAGMGLFYTLYYILVVAGPWLAGLFATAAGSAAATFETGAVVLGICIFLLGGCRALIARTRQAQGSGQPI